MSEENLLVVDMTLHTQVTANAQAPDQILNIAQIRVDGNLGGESNTTATPLMLEALPGAGLGPGPNEIVMMVLTGAVVLAGLGWVVKQQLRRPTMTP
jgi:hypothetical protein